MELGEPDESGRRRPIPVKGSEFIIPADAVAIAIGYGADPIVPQTTSGPAGSTGRRSSRSIARPDDRGPASSPAATT